MASKKEGRGIYWFASGDVDSSFYKQGAPVGEGVAWLADGQGAVRLRGGEAVGSGVGIKGYRSTIHHCRGGRE